MRMAMKIIQSIHFRDSEIPKFYELPKSPLMCSPHQPYAPPNYRGRGSLEPIPGGQIQSPEQAPYNWFPRGPLPRSSAHSRRQPCRAVRWRGVYGRTWWDKSPHRSLHLQHHHLLCHNTCREMLECSFYTDQ